MQWKYYMFMAIEFSKIFQFSKFHEDDIQGPKFVKLLGKVA